MTKTKNAASKAFASAPLVALAIRALRGIDPQLLPAQVKEPDYLADATIAPETKTAILEYAYNKGGALPLLNVGKTLGDLLFIPAGQVLMNSPAKNRL